MSDLFKFDIDISVSENGRKSPEWKIEHDLNGEITLADLLQFTKASLIIIADEVLTEEQAQGFDRTPIVAVDGKVGKPVINVNPLGSIEFTSRANVSTIITDTYDAITSRSPVLTGRYKSSNYVFLNGKQVATDPESLKSWIATNPEFKDSDLIRFVNIQPYGRKLERLGVTAQRQQSRTVRARGKKGKSGGRIEAPNGTYFLAARSIRSKYKRNSTISFQFIGGSALGLSASFKVGRKGKPGRPYVYPSILISVSESGIL